MGVSVVATAPSDGSHLVPGNMTTRVSSSHLIPSTSTTDHTKDIMGMSVGIVAMDLTLDMVIHH